MNTAYPNLKLTYFGLPGRGEAIRLILSIGGVPFENEIVSFTEWPKLKPTLPYMSLPVLTVNDQVLSQSSALARYAGALAGLYPSNDHVAALRVDDFFAYSQETADTYLASFKEQDPTKKAALLKYVADNELPLRLTTLEARLESFSQGPFVLGDKVSIADVYLYTQLRWLKSGFFASIDSSVVEGFPRITSLYEAVDNLPQVQAWYADKQ